MNPLIIISGCGLAGIILGKLLQKPTPTKPKSKPNATANANANGISSNNTNINTNKNINRAELLALVNQRVDKLERIKKKEAAKKAAALHVSDEVVVDKVDEVVVDKVDEVVVDKVDEVDEVDEGNEEK